jgi:hypothetical protein
MGLHKGLGVPIEQIEQVVGELHFQYDEKKPEGQRHLLLSNVKLIRAAKPFDWTQHLQALLPGGTEVRHAGKLYYKASLSAPLTGPSVTSSLTTAPW